VVRLLIGVALCVAALMIVTAAITLLAPYLAAAFVLFILYQVLVKKRKPPDQTSE